MLILLVNKMNIIQFENNSASAVKSQLIEAQMIQQIIDMGIDFYTIKSPDNELIYTSNRAGCLLHIRELGYDITITYPTAYGWSVNVICQLDHEHEFQLHQNEIGNGH